MIIAVSFGFWLAVCLSGCVLPWGMPQTATMQRTPKAHLIDWYPSGFT